MLKPKFFEAVPYSVEALCEKCGGVLRFEKTDFSRPKFSWLHKCNKCGKCYWLSDRYPIIVHSIKESSIQVDGYPPIEFEEYEDAK